MLARYTFLDQSLESFYSTSMTFVAILSALMAPLLATVILTQTPKYMKPFHYYLLNLVFWHFFDSFIVTTWWRPVYLYPMRCIGFNGILRDFGVYFGRFLLHARSTSVANVYTAIILCYVYRLAQLSARPEFLEVMSSRRGLSTVGAAHATATLIETLIMCTFYVDNTRALSDINMTSAERYTVTQLIEEEPGMICFTVGNIFSVIYIYYGIALGAVFTAAVLVLIVLIQIPFWGDMKAKVTRRCYDMHRTLTISLVSFAVIHILLKSVPVVVSIHLTIESKYYANLVGLLCNTAEVVEPLLVGVATLYFIHPYRRTLGNMCFRLRLRVLPIPTIVVRDVASYPFTAQRSRRNL